LERIYGKGWESFIANSGMINYFGSTDRKSADYFSALCGVTTVWNFSSAVSKAIGTSTGSGGTGSNDSVSTSDTRAASQRQLIYADELMRMRESNQLVFVDSMHPLIAQKLPWFENDDLKSKGINLHTK
jgi:type IV secretion system protein VirD4